MISMRVMTHKSQGVNVIFLSSILLPLDILRRSRTMYNTPLLIKLMDTGVLPALHFVLMFEMKATPITVFKDVTILPCGPSYVTSSANFDQ